MNRRRFLASGSAVFLPLILTAEPAVAQTPIDVVFVDVPPFGTGLNFTNPQIIGDRAGVYWCATRADSSIGGLVWRVDGYQGPEPGRRGTPTQVNPTDPAKFFANGELVIWPNGYLYYVTVEIDNLKDRNPLGQVAYLVPGWTP